jgi:penicillin-binding protein 1A
VLSEMESDGLIPHEEAAQAKETGLGLRLTQPESSVAPWFQEEVRRELEKQFGPEQVHEAGLRVDTTLDLDLQKTANKAVVDGLATYERRHGWKGKLQNVYADGSDAESYRHLDWALKYGAGDYVHAVVTNMLPTMVRARVGTDEVILQTPDWQWTGQRYADALVKPGDVIYVHLQEGFEGSARKATLEQDSGAQGALLMMDNTTGDVLAMVGGRDYAVSVFNRATQAERQTGSSFKPYVYTTAIEDGAKPDDIIVDGPVSFGSYTPHNYENDYKGAMTLINAFAESRNIPALKLAAHVGIHKVIDMAHRFGVTSNIPAYLPVALGAVEINLEEQVASYSVFPNDGIRVQPRMIRKVSNADGITLWEDPPQVKEVISQQTARTMMTLLRAVTAHGTGAAASQLNHPLGGKTGTTSDYTDAWFLGFSPSVTCGVWVGFDSRESLGEKETGAKAALPIWMTVMKQAIVGKDGERFLGDQGDMKAPLLQAKVVPPVVGVVPAKAVNKPAGTVTPKLPLPGLGTKSLTAAPGQGAPRPVSAAPTVKAAGAVLAVKPGSPPGVKPALPNASEPVKAKPAVKPALNPGR